MLSEYLVSELFAFLLVFCRFGTALMVMPGFGEQYVSMRVRLMLGLAISALLSPGLSGQILPPTSTFMLVQYISVEILIGLFIGGIARILITAIHLAGMIIAYQSGLASALVPDLSQATGGQGSVMGNLMAVTAMVLIFATDTHHLMLWGVKDSYNLFIPGAFPMVEDFANKAARVGSDAFDIALKLSAPHIVVGLVFYLGNGIIARLMPNIQIFFIMIPIQIMISFFILMLIISAIMMWYLEYFRAGIATFITGG
ncbi:MAG: flagellar biosynthetic protein FliR [Alphaproteobacteria bacterium]